MPSLSELRQRAREHTRRLEAIQWAGVNDLVIRWDKGRKAILAIPRSKLPYLEIGGNRERRYDPRDIETFEEREKYGAVEQAS